MRSHPGRRGTLGGGGSFLLLPSFSVPFVRLLSPLFSFSCALFHCPFPLFFSFVSLSLSFCLFFFFVVRHLSISFPLLPSLLFLSPFPLSSSPLLSRHPPSSFFSVFLSFFFLLFRLYTFIAFPVSLHLFQFLCFVVHTV